MLPTRCFARWCAGPPPRIDHRGRAAVSVAVTTKSVRLLPQFDRYYQSAPTPGAGTVEIDPETEARVEAFIPRMMCPRHQ